MTGQAFGDEDKDPMTDVSLSDDELELLDAMANDGMCIDGLVLSKDDRRPMIDRFEPPAFEGRPRRRVDSNSRADVGAACRRRERAIRAR